PGQLNGMPAQGVSISFPSCQTPVSHRIPLLTLTCLCVSPVTPRLVIARAHSSPANPAFNCANVVLCDGPTATRQCLPSCGLCIARRCLDLGCKSYPVCDPPLAAQPSTWTSVRQLYQAR